MTRLAAIGIVAAAIFALISTRKAVAGSAIWTKPAGELVYRDAIRLAEIREGIPAGMLTALLWAESRFRDDIISGETISDAGAKGIAQIVPRWHPDVDPLDPWASIDYAAGYLARLRRQLGGWDEALAGYNWGPGNVAAHGISDLPDETARYIESINKRVYA